MTPDRFVSIRVLYRFRTNLPERELVEFVAACGKAVENKMLEAWHSTDAVDVIEGRGLRLDLVGTVGPTMVAVVSSATGLLADEVLRRDYVADEIEYLRHLDEEATAAYEAERERGAEYAPEDDPYQGETTARYEEGQMP